MLWLGFRFANHLILIACSYPRGYGGQLEKITIQGPLTVATTNEHEDFESWKRDLLR